MTTVKRTLINRVNLSRLGHGIHDNTMITRYDTSVRKNKGVPVKKIGFITFVSVDKETKKHKASIEMSWFKPDITSDYFFTNFREFCVQLTGVLSSFKDKEEVWKEMEVVFKDTPFESMTTAKELENHKWKTSEAELVVNNILKKSAEILAPFIDDEDHLIRVKITTDKKGEYPNIPKYGIFTESMGVETSELMFSDYEKKNHSKMGITLNTNSNIDGL